MTRYLTERGFANSAPLFGEVVRVDADGTPNTFALVQGFVRNQGDGWSWTLDFLARSVEEVAQTGADQGDEASDVFVSYDVFAAAIGKRLGELHAILASPTDQPDFAPEQVDEARRRELGRGRDRADRRRVRAAARHAGMAGRGDRRPRRTGARPARLA